MKFIAYYLPQYHEIDENNKWWGEGHTEWTSTKLMKPLFKNHQQPKEPYNDNYYNLLNDETLKWQANLAVDYGIYGFCYYHYWFSGKMLLEKPAENLLENKEIKKNFCFCWANHDWKKSSNGKKEILQQQTYGNELEWKQHIEYLLPFFKDERYIKKEGKPVFLIYDAANIENVNDRIKFYDDVCKSNGLEGIYVIESINAPNSKKVSPNSSATVLREPAIAFNNVSLYKKFWNRLMIETNNGPIKYDYKETMEKILERAKKSQEKYPVYLGTFTNWDNTPRHQKRGSLVIGKENNLFKEFLDETVHISKERNQDMIFINAWNEWAEGMYMEPDKEENYSVLELFKDFK